MPKPADLLQGTLDLLILKTIAREPLHGWAISKRIQLLSRDTLSVGQGSLYPGLHRLEQQGWIRAEWKASESRTPGEILRAHARGPEATRAGAEDLGAAVVGGAPPDRDGIGGERAARPTHRPSSSIAVSRVAGRRRHGA